MMSVSFYTRYRKNVFRLDEIKLLFEKIRKDTAHTANDQEIEIEEKKVSFSTFLTTESLLDLGVILVICVFLY